MQALPVVGGIELAAQGRLHEEVQRLGAVEALLTPHIDPGRTPAERTERPASQLPLNEEKKEEKQTGIRVTKRTPESG